MAGGEVAVGDHQKHRLADVMHGTRGQQRLVMGGGAAIGHIGEISGRIDRAPRRGRRARPLRSIAVMVPCATVDRPKARCSVFAGRRQIVDIARLARDMQGGGVMGQGKAGGHGATSSTLTGVPARSWK